MLGKMSRARRAESASKRSGSGRSLASDRRKLCESSTSSESLMENDTGGKCDSADERIKQVKEALVKSEGHGKEEEVAKEKDDQ